ncbi:hypothetical protein C0991_000797 [Blastosporella zonata]|nr:hypothetical protein C0991_000797 [Blastosporella zonata]
MKGRESYFRSLSSDILRFDNLDSTISAVLDRTTMEVGFDLSCLEGLDDQLLSFPINAYAAICWAEAVHEPVGLLRGHFPDRLPPTNEQDEPLGSLTDDSDSDTDECRTVNVHSLETPMDAYGFAVNSHISLSSLNNAKSLFSSFESNEKILLEPRLTHFDPGDSIGLFSTPHEKVKTTAVAALRAYLPLRRKKPSAWTTTYV